MGVRVPDIYIIGAQKSGTTTLYDWLAQHPEIYAHPLAKDFPFFSNERALHDGSGLFHSFAKKAPHNQLVLGGEANAIYSPLGAQQMHQMMPSARLIAILRNPVQRAYSAYCYAVERLMEDRSLEQAICDELEGISYEPEDALQRDYLAHGQYARQLQKLYRFFSFEQVKVVIFEELKEEPSKTLEEIFQFIGVSDDFVPKMDVKNKTKGGYRSKLLAKIIHGRPSYKVVRSLGRALIPYSLRTGFRRKLVNINRVERPKPEFPDHVRELIEDYYSNQVTELESLLGREITAWNR